MIDLEAKNQFLASKKLCKLSRYLIRTVRILRAAFGNFQPSVLDYQQNRFKHL